VDFFWKLFDTSDFPARWHCGHWTAGHGYLHIISDLGVWSAYLAIPCVLGYFALQRKDVPFRTLFWLFGAFILACGTTHLMEAVLFWWPAYRLAGLIKLFTAVVSWGTVVALVPFVPRALAMRSPDDLEREIAERKRAERAMQESYALLRAVIEGIPRAVYVKDLQGRYLMINSAGARMIDKEPQEVLGRDDTTLFEPETAQRFMEEDQRVMESGTRTPARRQGSPALT